MGNMGFYAKESSSVIERIRKAKLESDSKFKNSFNKYYVENNKFKIVKQTKYCSSYGGIPLGYNEIDDSISVDSSDIHSMIIGSTGSKKSRLVIMPTVKILAAAGESMIISDPKSEIYSRTADGLNQCGYKIYVVNLRNPSYGNSWNPLAIPYRMYLKGEIDKAYEFVNDVSINLMLADVSEKDPYWDYSARDLFFGLTLAVFKYCKEYDEPADKVNFRNLIKFRKEMFLENDSTVKDKCIDFVKGDEIIYSSLIGTLSAPDKTQSCILSTFDEKMRPFMIQPNLLDMMSFNDIDLDNIGEKQSVIYLIMPDEKTSYHKLVTIFIKQSYEYLIFKAQSMNENRMHVRVNYILDEFSSLPTIRDFPAMITAARSRNIRFNLVIQSKNQLVMRYREEAETIFTNCSNWVFLTSRELEILEDISRLCGDSYNTGKRIIPPAALQHLDKNRGEALIISGRLYPYISVLKDISYYDNDVVTELKLIKRTNKNSEALNFTFKQNKEIKPHLINKEGDTSKQSVLKVESEEELKIQKELNKKFDELFGDSDI